MASEKTIGRLSLYRRLLGQLKEEGAEYVFSYQLASLAGSTAAQVRRDIMDVGYSGSPTKGYGVDDLMDAIAAFLDPDEGQKAVLVGVGNLGRALLAYFVGRQARFGIEAAFDADPDRAGRVICGCRCFAVQDLEDVTRQKDAAIGIVTVPVEVAQDVAETLVRGGVKGILNFAPVRLRVPPEVYVENIDMTMALEKVGFFARNGTGASSRKGIE